MFFRLFIISSLVLLSLVGCTVEEATPIFTPIPAPDIPTPTSPTPLKSDVAIYTNDQVSDFANASLQPPNISGDTLLQKQITSVSYSGDGIWQVTVEWEYDLAIDSIVYRFYEGKGHFEIDSITIFFK